MREIWRGLQIDKLAALSHWKGQTEGVSQLFESSWLKKLNLSPWALRSL